MPFRTWEIVVIGIALVLFVLAAFAGPATQPPGAVAPTAGVTPPAGVSAPIPTPGVSPSGVPASPSVAPSSPAAPVSSATPVASVDQIIAEEVGDYIMVDRRPAEAGAQGGAVEAVELRYEQTPAMADTDVFHAIEVHLDAGAAEERVRTFARAMDSSGYEIVREQPLRGSDGERQGYFVSLTGAGQPLLLWSNQNVTFTLGGGKDADVEAFYESLPY